MSLHLPALRTLVAVPLYVMTLLNVAFARSKFKVTAPAAKRQTGALIGFATLAVLWAGALWGVVGALLRS